MNKANFDSDKKKKIIICSVVAVALIGIIVAVAAGRGTGKNAAEDKPTENITQNQEVENVIVQNENKENKTEGTEETSTDVLTLEDPTKETVTAPKKNGGTNTNTNTVKPAVPVKPSQPSGTVQGSGKVEVIDNGNDSVYEYSCGVKGHHCDSKETHNFITNLEKKGCPYCGSHSCKSFYTYDEWGNACYDPTKCESYSAQKDPNNYCQECGKKIGNGSNGTCVRFTVDTKCPGCKKQVSAKTCHSH